MIFADKIIEERKRKGWSQEELAEKLDVSRQAVSKWESARALPDIQKIVTLSELFGVSVDYLIKDNAEKDSINIESEIEAVNESVENSEKINLRAVTADDVAGFLKFKKSKARKIALGVALCIISPTPMFLLSNEIGVSLILLLIAAAVMLFVGSVLKDNPCKFVSRELIELQDDARNKINNAKAGFGPVYRRRMACGIALFILCVVPLIIGGKFTVNAGNNGITINSNTNLAVIMLCVLLLMVAAGVYLVVSSTIIRTSINAVLVENSERIRRKEEKQAEEKQDKKMKAFSGIYWSIVTLIYLLWSFISFDWDITWIIWPIAALIKMICRKIMVIKNTEE